MVEYLNELASENTLLLYICVAGASFIALLKIACSIEWSRCTMWRGSRCVVAEQRDRLLILTAVLKHSKPFHTRL